MPEWRQPGSNRRPRACKARALPTELCPRLPSKRGKNRPVITQNQCIHAYQNKLRTRSGMAWTKRRSTCIQCTCHVIWQSQNDVFDHILRKNQIRRFRFPRILLRKEVIQPQVPLRLPCYDFIPITPHTFGAFLPHKCGLDRRLRVQKAFMM
jgi:hypothetical protein